MVRFSRPFRGPFRLYRYRLLQPEAYFAIFFKIYIVQDFATFEDSYTSCLQTSAQFRNVRKPKTFCDLLTSKHLLRFLRSSHNLRDFDESISTHVRNAFKKSENICRKIPEISTNVRTFTKKSAEKPHPSFLQVASGRKGLLDALADGLERSEMDDTLVRPLGEDLRQRLLVAQVDLHELDLGWLPRDLLHAVDGDVEGVDEIIHDGDPVASKAALGTVLQRAQPAAGL